LQWASFAPGDGFVSIDTSSDPSACRPPCTYYIGVNGFGVNGFAGSSSYTIVVTPSATNRTVHLLDGVPQFGHVPPHKFAYFQLDTANTATPVDVEISVSSFSGNIEVYVAQQKIGNVTIMPQLYCNNQQPQGASCGACALAACCGSPSTRRHVRLLCPSGLCCVTLQAVWTTAWTRRRSRGRIVTLALPLSCTFSRRRCARACR
jgi:hypothetical protein